MAEGLSIDLEKGVLIVGRTAALEEVRGTTLVAASTGDTILLIQCTTATTSDTDTDTDTTSDTTTTTTTKSTGQPSVGCHVGGNPDPVTTGCLAPAGSLEIGEIGEFDYTYNPLQDNFNARTLQGLSTGAELNMYIEPLWGPYFTCEKFYNYYGVFDYGNQWILASFNKGSTSFAKGNADFALYDDTSNDGINGAIQGGIVYLNVWMHVIGQMERAIDNCQEANDDASSAWDEAVAFYVGSGTRAFGGDDNKNCHLLYTLAQERCENFGTCTADTGEAKVNRDVFQTFHEGKLNLLMGNCEETETIFLRITQLMTIPLVQSTLRYAYLLDKQKDTRETTSARGAACAASVLPLLNACNETDADLVYDNMRVGRLGLASFRVVKAALERNYACLGITYNDVNGLIDSVTGGYLPDAEPCGYLYTDGTNNSNCASNTDALKEDPDLAAATLAYENQLEAGDLSIDCSTSRIAGASNNCGVEYNSTTNVVLDAYFSACDSAGGTVAQGASLYSCSGSDELTTQSQSVMRDFIGCFWAGCSGEELTILEEEGWTMAAVVYAKDLPLSSCVQDDVSNTPSLDLESTPDEDNVGAEVGGGTPASASASTNSATSRHYYWCMFVGGSVLLQYS